MTQKKEDTPNNVKKSADGPQTDASQAVPPEEQEWQIGNRMLRTAFETETEDYAFQLDITEDNMFGCVSLKRHAKTTLSPVQLQDYLMGQKIVQGISSTRLEKATARE